MCIKHPHLATMLHCECCLQYIKSLVLLTLKTSITQKLHWNNVIISPLTQHQYKQTKNTYLPYWFFWGMSQEPKFFFSPYSDYESVVFFACALSSVKYAVMYPDALAHLASLITLTCILIKLCSFFVFEKSWLRSIMECGISSITYAIKFLLGTLTI